MKRILTSERFLVPNSIKSVLASITAWYNFRLVPSDATNNALGELLKDPKVELGSSVGNHATLENADASGELIRASSDIPPDLDKGPIGSTLQRISSLQKPPGPGSTLLLFKGRLAQHPCISLSWVHCWLEPVLWKLCCWLALLFSSGMLWCDVVSMSGSTGWHAAELVRKRWPLTRDACATLSTVENLEPSANEICHWLSEPSECFESMIAFGVSWLSLCPGEFFPAAFAVKTPLALSLLASNVLLSDSLSADFKSIWLLWLE